MRGSLAFLQHTRFDIAFAISFFGSFQDKPTELAWKYLVLCAQYARATADYGIVFWVRPVNEFAIEAYCDASFGKHAQEGYIVAVNGSPILWRSGKQRCVALSTMKAELRAMYNCMDSLILNLHLFSQLQVKCYVKLYSDALNVVTLIRSPHPKPAEKHLLIEICQMQAIVDGDLSTRVARLRTVSEKLMNRDVHDCMYLGMAIDELTRYMPTVPIHLEHCEGLTNPADAFTKSVDVCLLVDRYTHKVSTS